VEMIDSMHERSARAMVSMATSAAGSRIAAVQRMAEGHADCPAIVYLIATDWQIRDRLRGALLLRGLDVRCFASAAEFLQRPRDDSEACVIAELRPGGSADYELQQQLTAAGGPPIIFVGSQLDMPSGIRAIKAGALDFLVHPVEPEDLYCAVEEAFRSHRNSRQRQGEIAALNACYRNLTRREREVFALVVQGFLNKQVAGMLAISIVTVQIHRSNTMRKMGARSFADLVCMALMLRIFQKDFKTGDSSNCSATPKMSISDSDSLLFHQLSGA
jgi:FixJ family two-component response regulator